MHNPFGLYVVLTDPVAGYEACTQAAVNQGIQFVQLRIKNRPQQEILEIAHKLRAITKESDTCFIVNDSLEIAISCDADGVHLGQDDMPIADARKQWNNPKKIFGLSTHNIEQLLAAKEVDPDYIGIGPVFPTPTKANPDPTVGLELMGSMIDHAGELPSVAIGGINEENLESVLAAGAINFCAVRAIMQSPNPEGVIARMMHTWKNHYRLD